MSGRRGATSMADRPIPRWLVRTPQPVNGRTLHFFDCRRKQRQFATENHGERYEVRRSQK